MRMLVGAGVGIVVGAILPVATGDNLAFMATAAELVISLGRFAIYPLLFFGVIIAIHELRQDKATLRVYGRGALVIVSATGAMVLVATLVTLFLEPRRIPPIFQEAAVPALPPLPEYVQEVFPRNMFALFAGDGTFLLPIVLLAVALGLVLYKEGSAALPAVDVVDSLARTFYRLNWWILEVIAVGLIAVSAAWLMQLRSVSDLQLFAPLLWVVGSVSALFVLVLFPLAVFFFGDRYSPFAWLYALVAPGITAFFSGDSYFTVGPLTRAAKENFGVSREIAAPVISVSTLIAKSGSAMVIAATFITVLRSYTALEIGLLQVLWVMGSSFLFSFLLGRVPGATVLVGLSVLSQSYGQGMNDIYLIVLPALPILTGIAVLVDTMTAALTSFLVGVWERKRRIVDPYDFV